MIKFQQSQAITSHFESFWSIVLLVPFQSLIFSQLPKEFGLSSFTKCPNSCWQMHAPLLHLCFDGCGATHCKVLQLQNGLDNGIFSLAKMKYFFSWYCCHVNSSFRQLRGVKIWKKWDHSKVRPWFWPKMNFHGINKVINCCQSIQNIWKSTLVIGLFCHFENFLNISISSTFDLILKVEELAGT